MGVICTNAGECFYGTSSTPRMQRESSAFKCDHCEPHVRNGDCSIAQCTIMADESGRFIELKASCVDIGEPDE